jgi:hypothetical protein
MEDRRKSSNRRPKRVIDESAEEIKEIKDGRRFVRDEWKNILTTQKRSRQLADMPVEDNDGGATTSDNTAEVRRMKIQKVIKEV